MFFLTSVQYFGLSVIEIRTDMLNYGLKVINTKDHKVFKDKGAKSRGVIKLLDEIWSIKELSSNNC